MFGKRHALVTVFGIEIALTASWAIIAGLIAWTLATQVFPQELPGASPVTHAFMGLCGAAIFFLSLLLHELSHAMVARHFGLRVPRITLFLFGGVAELEEEPSAPKDEFWIAIAGPIMSLALALLFWIVATLEALVGISPPAQAVLGYLSLINLVLAIFNMLPAFPLDGGRVLRAALWWNSGDIVRATEIAGKTGMVFAYVLIGLGFLALFDNSVVGGAWQILLGLFVFAAAKGSVEAQNVKSYLGGRHVRHLMTPDPITASPDMSLADLVNRVFLAHRISFAPVCEREALLGYIDTGGLSDIERENWQNTRVGDVFVGLSKAATLQPQDDVEEVLNQVRESGRRKFLVVDGNDLVGVITLADVSRYLSLMTEIGDRHLHDTARVSST